MKNKIILFFIVIALAACSGALYFLTRSPIEITKDQRCLRCNVILISADSVRVDRMSLYGYKKNTTPTIDAWAKNALVFENYYASAFLTPVSEASVHSGLYPEVNGVVGFRRTFGDQVKTLAQRFQEKGYTTIAHGNSSEFVRYVSLNKSFIKGFDFFHMQKRFETNTRRIQWEIVKKKMAATKGPFFFWIPIGDAHSPFGWNVPAKFSSSSYKGPFAGWGFTGNLEIYYDRKLYELTPERSFHFNGYESKQPSNYFEEQKLLRSVKKWPYQVTDEDLEFINAKYDDGIALVDSEFSDLLQVLKETGHLEDTVIVFQSEHGESLGEHKYVAHYDVMNTQTHVPLIIKSPAIKEGSRHQNLLSGVDILPTLLHHVGIPFDETVLDGKNFLDSGKVLPSRDVVFITRIPLWETLLKIKDKPQSLFSDLRMIDDKKTNRDYAIIMGNFKLIHRLARSVENKYSVIRYVTGKAPVREEFELYNLAQDPLEDHILSVDAFPEGKIMKERLLDFEKTILAKAVTSSTTKELEDYL